MYINPACWISLLSQFTSLFDNGFIDVYSGARPSDPTQPPTGTKIGYITDDGEPVTPGVATNGLTWGTPYESADGLWVILPFAPACVPRLFCTLADGQNATAGWMRLFPNVGDDGLEDTDNTRPRIDIVASTTLDSLVGGVVSATGSQKYYGQTKSSFNAVGIRWPRSNGQAYSG